MLRAGLASVSVLNCSEGMLIFLADEVIATDEMRGERVDFKLFSELFRALSGKLLSFEIFPKLSFLCNNCSITACPDDCCFY